MAFNDTSAIQDWRYLVEITLDSGVVRYSTDNHVLTDGTFYGARLLNVSTLRLSAGSLLDPRIITPSLSITLDNSDLSISAAIDAEEWGNRAVSIKVGQGQTPGDYQEIFAGVVLFPGGISFDDAQVFIELNNSRAADERVLPTSKFFVSTYPNVDTVARNLPIPLIYGDFLTSAGGGETVPCYCIDTTAGTGGKWKIANHALKQIEVIYLNGSDITGNCTLDAANGEFTISATSTYDPITDTVTANVQGITDDGLTTGTLLQSLPDIMEDLLTDKLSVSASALNTAAFAAWESNLNAADYGRRWIGAELSSNTLLTDLLVDGFADMVIQDGQYFPIYRIAGTSSLDQYRDFDIIADNSGRKVFSVVRDPERNYLNEIVAQYRYNPSGAEYAQRYDAENAAALSQVNARKRRRLKLTWLYKTNGAEDRAQRELLAYSTETEVLDIEIGPRAISKIPTDQFRVIYNKYLEVGGFGTPFQVRDIATNFKQMSATIRAWNVLNLTPGRWTSDSATTWLLSTGAQRAENGYWTDASGYADTSGSPDETSKRSKYF